MSVWLKGRGLHRGEVVYSVYPDIDEDKVLLRVHYLNVNCEIQVCTIPIG